MAKKYATGHAAWGECGRCAGRDLLSNLVFDGYYPNMRVHRSCYEPKHPQENLKRIDDPVALWRPSPENLNPPTAPVLSGNLLSVTSVRLTWTESVSDISQVDVYHIYRRVDGGAYEFLADFDVTRDMFGARTNTLQYVDTIEFALHTYAYYLIAEAVQGGSAQSNILDLSTVHAVDIQQFTANGTWAKPTDAVWVEVTIFGGGGGGGGGCSTANDGTPAAGGSGGAGGGYSTFCYLADALPATVAVTVGSGGAGGIGKPNGGGHINAGGDGGFGGNSSFGAYLTALGGGAGIGGTAGPQAGGSPGIGLDSPGGRGGSGSGSPSQNSVWGGTGGGLGGGSGGGSAGGPTGETPAGCAVYEAGSFTSGAGGGSGVAGGAGTFVNELAPGTAGGGGGRTAAGGAAARAAAGGGGGGGNDLNAASGAGGAGGRGIVLVVSYL